MKPTKNNFFCLDSNKTKMRFETEKKALNFIKFNSHEIEKETGKAPTRCYFCIACNSYHVTSNKIDYKIKSKTEHILEQYNQDINKKKRKKKKYPNYHVWNMTKSYKKKKNTKKLCSR